MFSVMYPFMYPFIHHVRCFCMIQIPIISRKGTIKQAQTVQQRQRNYHKAPNVKQLKVSLAATRLWFIVRLKVEQKTSFPLCLTMVDGWMDGWLRRCKRGHERMMMIRRVEAALTEVGKLQHQHYFSTGRIRERQKERDSQKERNEAGKCKTEFKDCTAKALSKQRISLESCDTIIRL